MKQHNVHLVVSGSWLVTMDQNNSVIREGGLAISGDTIVDLGPGKELAARYPQAEHLHEPYGLIMPGLINCHTHAPMSCFRGLADDLPLMQWLQEVIFPREARLNREIVYHSTLLSICEMIRSGTTSFCDMYLFADEVARASDVSGIRAWIGEVLYDFPSPNYGEPENGLRYTEQLFADWDSHELITITVDPHAVYTCSPDLLQRLGEMARQHQALYVIHLAENEDEVSTCWKRYDCSPVFHLENLGLLNHRVVADHCVMLTPEEIRLLAERQVKVVHCPESNMKLASGIAPVPAMLEGGLTVGLGTDGCASNNNADMFGEMNSAAKIHKVDRMDPTVMDSWTTLHMATRGGARVLGVEQSIGSLEPGKKADCIVLDLNQPHLTPLYNPASHLVYAARGSDVVHSIINGRFVLRDRILTTLDEDAILSEMRLIAESIRAL